MKSIRPISRLLGTLALLAAAAAPCTADSPGDLVPAQLVLRLQPGVDIAELIDPFQVAVAATFPARNLFAIEALPGHEDELDDLLDQYRRDVRVDGCEKNVFNGVIEGSTQSFFVRVPPPPDFRAQPTSLKLGLPTAQKYSTGAGITVAVLDTGISEHPYLAGYVLPGYDWLHDSPDISDLPDGIDQDGDGTIDEMAGHGTFVSGVIHTSAPDAMIIPIKVLDSDGFGTTFALAAGIYDAIDRGADVINISLISPEESTAVNQAVAEAVSRGVVVIAAAGNEFSGRETFPAASPGAIAVAAVDLYDQVLAYSGHGDHISLCAPGLNVLSILPGDEQASASGTSVAAAFVSGIAALHLAKEPWLSPGALRARLMSQAVGIDALNPGLEGELGAGRVTTWGLSRVHRRTLPKQLAP